MNKLLTIIIICFSAFQFMAQVKIKGHFDAIEVLNEHQSMDSAERAVSNEFFSTLDLPLIEDYLGLLREMKFEQADSIIKQDERLKNIPERGIAVLYTIYYVYKNELVDLYALTCLDEKNEINCIVFMDLKSFTKYNNKLEEEITMKVKLVQEIPLTQTVLYRLK
jgi:hypothetical protein